MCDGHSTVTVPAPAWLRTEGRETVALDGCISEVVPELWEQGVVTLGSCCGHGASAPSLVLAEEQSPFAARDALAAIDGRTWDLFRWQLVDADEASRETANG